MNKALLKKKLIASRYYEVKDNLYLPIESNQNSISEVKNFGIQWNLFKKTQFDSFTNQNLTESRLKKCSGWDLNKLKGKFLLEMGSGAGRFTEVFLKYGAIVVSVELSSAIFANYKNNQNKNLLLVRDSIFNFKCEEITFDYVFCYGVSQHVQNPIDIYKTCVNHLKLKTGLLSIDHYWKRLGEKIPCFLYYSKYLWRPITKRLNPSLLLLIIKAIYPIILPLDIFLKIFPKIIYKIIKIIIPIPIANYFKEEGIDQNYKNLLNWCIMDTFDMLGAKYDEPWTYKKLCKVAKELNIDSFEVKKVTNNANGLVLNGTGKK
ncbi:MAG: class I SAM-dependent methyltransferase [Prochlorococcus marinus subsp. pastoris]